MGGRNKGSGAGPGYAGQYTIETVDFWCDDFRVQKLPPASRALLLYLGLYATRERREVLPVWYTKKDIVCKIGGDSRGMSKLFDPLFANLLADETEDGRLIVCGAMKRRPNLIWKTDGICADIVGIRGYISHQAVSSKQEERKGAYAPGSESQKEKQPIVIYRKSDGRTRIVEIEAGITPDLEDGEEIIP